MNKTIYKYNLDIEKINKIRNFIRKQKYIKLAYLFGSYATKNQGYLSDIDIAFYLNPSLNKKQLFNKELFLRAKLNGILKTNKLIDVVIMNEAPTTLNFKIIKNGKILFEKDKDIRVDIETRIMSKYLDRRYYDKRYLNNFFRKVKIKGLIQK